MIIITKFKSAIFGLILLLFAFTITSPVLAQVLQNPISFTEVKSGAAETIVPTNIIGNIVNAVIRVSGSLALVLLIYGAVLITFSAGNEERVKKGKTTIFYAILGLIVVAIGYALVEQLIGLIGAFIISRGG